MKYTDLVFDLYGTLVDIHTEEDDTVWEKTAIYFGCRKPDSRFYRALLERQQTRRFIPEEPRKIADILSMRVGTGRNWCL